MSWGRESSEMGATAHAEGMMGSALEHEPSGLDMILDMVRLRVPFEPLGASGCVREVHSEKPPGGSVHLAM